MFKKRAKGAEIILALVAEKARASPGLKELLAMKKQSHNQFIMLDGHNRYLIFSRLHAQCKFESKRLYSNYLRNMQ